MKKILITTVLAATLLTACGTPNYTVDTSNMPAEKRQQHEQELQELLTKYETVQDAAEKSETAFSIGFKYMSLGEHGKAIQYYEEVLEFDAVHFPALTNLAYIYETAGEYGKAIEYQKRLYDANMNLASGEVTKDLIRLYVENGQFDEAEKILNEFKTSANAEGNEEFIKDQEEFINNAKSKTP